MTHSKTAILVARMIAFVGARLADGATYDECTVGLGLAGYRGSPAARWAELRATRVFVENGKRRRTRDGHMASVHVVRPGATIVDWVRGMRGVRARQQMERRAATAFKRLALAWATADRVEREQLASDFTNATVAFLSEIHGEVGRS